MLTRTFLTVVIIGLLTNIPTQTVSANSFPITHYGIIETAASLNLMTDIFKFNGMAVKRGEPYDEAKDPALRKGTENWEQSQSNFWLIPTLVIGLVAVILLFNRD